MRITGNCKLDNSWVRPTMICQDFTPKSKSKESDCKHCVYYIESKINKEVQGI